MTKVTKEVIIVGVLVSIFFIQSHEIARVNMELSKMTDLYSEVKQERDALFEVYQQRNDCVYTYEGVHHNQWR